MPRPSTTDASTVADTGAVGRVGARRRPSGRGDAQQFPVSRAFHGFPFHGLPFHGGRYEEPIR